MSIAGAFPGLIWQPDFRYQPRWPWGQDGYLRVISCICAESIPPGVMLQINPGVESNIPEVRIARDATRLVGVGAYDPDKYDHAVIYDPGDVLPVVRRGTLFVAFSALLPPFRDPQPCELARFYAGPARGQFTTDVTGTLSTPRAVFTVATKDYYQTSSGSPQADVPLDIPPIPLGELSTTFGTGVALVELSLP